jgi:acyl-CoA synthetase (AMP-forming)/AMP-acid ligase II
VEGVRDQLVGVREFIARGAADGGDRSGGTGYEDWIARQPDVPVDRTVRETDDLYQMYTSGTTGRPKGAVLTHRAVTSHLEQVSPFFRVREGERGLGVAPMYHAAGCLLAFRTVADGGSVYLMAEFDPVEVVRVLDEERIGAAIMVPAMIQACLVSAPDAASRRYADLRTIYYGSSPIAAETLRRAVAVFGCDFHQAYGMTELTAGSTNLNAEDHRRALADQPGLLLSAGRPLMGTEIRIVDEDGRPVATGVVGEILMRGPQMMRGYWNMPDETAEALRGGWMHTGDAGRLDAAGYLYVVDRLKDMIVSGGENVYPRAVEDVLFEHPSIADAAVIGVPDDRWGETVKAIVVLREGAAASEAEVIDYCRERLGGLQRPRSVEFRETLPHAANGKLLKRVLREPYWAGRERRVGGS